MAPRLGTELNCINAELALIGFRPDQAASFPSAAPLSLPVQFNSGDGRRVFAEAGNDHLQPEVTLNNGRWARQSVDTAARLGHTVCVCVDVLMMKGAARVTWWKVKLEGLRSNI